MEGRSPKKFFPPFGPQFGLKMGVGLRVPPLDPPLCLLCELFENLFTELAGKLGFAHSFGFIFYGTKPWKNTPENVELSEFFFSLHVLIIFILHASMWSHYMFSLFFGEKNQLNEPLLGNYSEGEEERLTLKPDRMPRSDICHNMNK